MKIPIIRGVIDRRILVNFRVDPVVLSRLLPAPFRPKRVQGRGVAGICLIRLKNVRPAFLPAWAGIDSENAAHRIAVEWNQDHKTHEGVYINRRDTSSRLNALAGGRIFPGVHHHARFRVEERADAFAVAYTSDDGAASVSVRGRQTASLPAGSVFRSMLEASSFFQNGSLGYSPSRADGRFQGLELRVDHWRAEPLEIEEARSSYFENEALFPKGSAEFDCALLMERIEHQWLGRPDLCCDSATRCNESARIEAEGAPAFVPAPANSLLKTLKDSPDPAFDLR